MPTALGLASRIAAGPPVALALTKRIVYHRLRTIPLDLFFRTRTAACSPCVQYAGLGRADTRRDVDHVQTQFVSTVRTGILIVIIELSFGRYDTQVAEAAGTLWRCQ